jgi:hypothetical protein
MISSRWPRPTGISASMALRPVCIGSCTDLRGMMPGAFTSTRRRSVALIGPLPSIGLPSAVDDAAEQALADRHVDDGAGALDGVAFLDVAVVAEDHDADVVGFEVQAMPLMPPGNSTISPAWTLSRPWTRAMPSPTDSTWPTSAPRPEIGDLLAGVFPCCKMV